MAGRFQVDVDVNISDRGVDRFLSTVRRAVASVGPTGGTRGQTEQLARAEVATQRNLGAGTISAADAARIRRSIQQESLARGITPGAVSSQAQQVSLATRSRLQRAETGRARVEEQLLQEGEKQLRAARAQRPLVAGGRAARVEQERVAEEERQANAARRAAAQRPLAAQTNAERRAEAQRPLVADRDPGAEARARRAEERQRVHDEAVERRQRREVPLQADRGGQLAAQRRASDQRAIAANNLETAETIRSAAQRRASDAERARAIQREENAINRAANAAADSAAPRTQRIQQVLGERATGQYRPAASFPGFGQLLGARALSVASYAAPGALLFGAIRTVKEVGQEVLKLERVTARLRSQFDALGKSSEFAAFRADILGIARDTGVAGDQVAFVGLQMQGAFGKSELAIAATEQAIRAAQVSGLGLVEIVDSLTAASISYKVSIDEITDKAIGLEQRFGVVNEQSIKAFGDIAPVAEAAGLSIDKVGAILGVVQQRSGRATTSITEALGRILPSIGEKAADLVAFARTAPKLAQDASRLAQALNEGRTGDALLLLTQRYKDLTTAQQQNLTFLLGGRREAQTLTPLFAGSEDITKELANIGQDAGKAIAYQQEQQRTLGYQLGRVTEEVNQLGDALARLGVIGGLAIVAGGFAQIVGVIGDALRVAVEFNDTLGGIPATVLSIYTAVRTLNVALATLQALQASKVLSALGSAVTGRAAAAGIVLPGAQAAPVAPLYGAGGAVGAGVGAGGAAIASRTIFGLSPVGAAITLALAGAVIGLNKLRQAAEESAAAERARFEGKDFVEGLKLPERQKSAAEIATESFFDPSSIPDFFSSLKDSIGDGIKDLTSTDFHVDFSERDKALAAAAIPAVQAGTEGGLLDFGKDTKAIEESLAHPGTVEAAIALDRVKAAVSALSDTEQRQLQNLIGAKAAADTAAGTGAAQISATVETLTNQYQAGKITYASYIAGLRDAAAVAASVRNATPENAQAAIDAANVVGAALQSQVERTAAVAEALALLGGADPITTAMDTARSLIDNANIVQSPESAQALIDTILQGYKDLLTRAIDHATGEVKKALELNGLKISPEDQARINRLYASMGIGTFVAPPSSGNPLADLLAGSGIAGGTTNQTFKPTEAPPVVKQDPETTYQDHKGDAAAAESAADKARRAAAELAKARFALLEAMAGDNEILLAQLKVDAAKDEEQRARMGSLADQLNAQANRITAERGFRDAFRNLGKSMNAVASAMAAAVGDVAEVGRLTIVDAQADLDRAQKEGGPTEINNARAALITAQAAERDRARQARVADLEYLFEFDKITAGQLIQGLTAELAQIPETNKEARREIERRIRQLREDMGRDFQFNLPDIILPTQYEGRRLTQGGYGNIGGHTGGGTPTATTNVDNRTISITLNANNAVDGEAAVDKIVTELNRPPRYGTRPRFIVGA